MSASLGDPWGAERRPIGNAWSWRAGQMTEDPPSSGLVSCPTKNGIKWSELVASAVKVILFYTVPLQETDMTETLWTWTWYPFLSLDWLHEIFSSALASTAFSPGWLCELRSQAIDFGGGALGDSTAEQDQSIVPWSSSSGKVVGSRVLIFNSSPSPYCGELRLSTFPTGNALSGPTLTLTRRTL